MEAHGASQHDGLGETEGSHCHHEGEGGAEGDALLEENDCDRHDRGATAIHGDSEGGGEWNRENSGAFDEGMNGLLRDVIMNKGADPNADHDPNPNLTDDADGFVDTVAETQQEVELCWCGLVLAGLDKIALEEVTEFHFTKDRTCGGANEKPAGDVGESHGNSEFTRHEDDEVFVDDGGGDEEGEGYTEGDAGLEKAYKNGDGGAGTKGGDGTEEGGYEVTPDAAPVHPFAEAVFGQPGAEHPDREDHDCQKKEDLEGVVDKEMEGRAEFCIGVEACQIIDQTVGRCF